MIQLRSTALALVMTCSISAFAQDAQTVLDAAAARIQKAGCIRAQFKATSFSGTTPKGETMGSMLIKGSKFQMTTPELTTWFDGKTQWSMLREAGEVNITEPTEEEIDAMNPAAFVNLYKKGYRATLRPSILRGQKTYEVHLTATKSHLPITEIYVDVTQKDHTLLCVRAKQDGNWTRLSILSFDTDKKAKDSDFQFPSKDFPNIELIDLR